MSRASDLFTSKAKFRATAEALTSNMPSLLLLAHQIAAAIDVGQHGRRKAGAGEDFWQFKKYTQGDDRTEIDWRQSAKRGDLYIRQKELESSENAWFWINDQETMFFKSKTVSWTKLEFVKLVTFSLLILLNKADENFAMLGKMPKCGHGASQLDAAAAALFDDKELTFEDAVFSSKITSKSQFILASDFLMSPETLKAQLVKATANGSNGLLLHVADPAEIMLPYSGRAIFQDMSGNPVISFKQVQTIQSDYQKAFNRHKESLMKIAAQLGWRYFFCPTDTDPANIIAKAYQILSEET